MSRHARRLALIAACLLAAPVTAQPRPPQAPAEASKGMASGFIDIAPPAGEGPVRLAVSQLVRIGRLEGETVIDTTAFVQQRTPEAGSSLAQRVAAAGVRLVQLTDPGGQRTWIAADKVVLVRETESRHAAGTRAAIILTGLRYTRDVAVKESVAEVMAALAR